MGRLWGLFRSAPSVEQRVDAIVRGAFATPLPDVLYHYTSWEGAEGILSSQEFWATAHDSTNDPGELVTADAVILDVAGELQEGASVPLAQFLKHFVDGFPALHVTRMAGVFLTCFSDSRDDRHQWCNYGAAGKGICLGVRVLNEAGPKHTRRGMGSGIISVDYDEQSWRQSLREQFQKVCSALPDDPDRKSVTLVLGGLHRIAALAAVRAKGPSWAPEREFRLLTVVHPDSGLERLERPREGRMVGYTPVRARQGGRHIWLDEVVLGPNQDTAAARARMEALLVRAGYVDIPEVPRITASTALPC